MKSMPDVNYILFYSITGFSMLRLLDIIFSLIGLTLFFPFFVVLLIIGCLDSGSPLFLQKRVGRNLKVFTLIKFRTMKVGTASVATHLADASTVTTWGGYLRSTKLDELPQLWNVLIGEMSLVGPRPCLPSQRELIQERIKRSVFNLRPGITGLAQINNIDMSTPVELAIADAEMISSLNFKNYFSYIFLTVIGKGSGDLVS